MHKKHIRKNFIVFEQPLKFLPTPVFLYERLYFLVAAVLFLRARLTRKHLALRLQNIDPTAARRYRREA